MSQSDLVVIIANKTIIAQTTVSKEGGIPSVSDVQTNMLNFCSNLKSQVHTIYAS